MPRILLPFSVGDQQYRVVRSYNRGDIMLSLERMVGQDRMGQNRWDEEAKSRICKGRVDTDSTPEGVLFAAIHELVKLDPEELK